jgi:hypothetical protein
MQPDHVPRRARGSRLCWLYAWVVTDHDGNPVFDRLGMLELDPDARCGVPSVGSEEYRSTIRDAYLLAGR